MAGTDTIPELEYQKPDGSLLTRLEMEQQMRNLWPKIHWIRIKANKVYGLPKQAAFDMREVTLRHWTLDEMTRRGQIVGDVAGVDAQTYNDDAVTRQFTQRLQYLIQTGQAIMPQEGEGIDMSNFVPPPPPMSPPNGQVQQMAFQPPVQGPPHGYAPPMPGSTAPVMSPPQMPTAPPQGFSPPTQSQSYAMPMPGTGMPQMPQTPVPPMPGTPPPQQAAPSQGGGRRGRRGGGEATPQQAAPVPPMPSGPPGMPAQNFAGPPQSPQGFVLPQPPQGFAPQMQMPTQAQAPAPIEDPTTQKKLDQILANQQQILSAQAKLDREWSVLQAGLAAWLRATYQRPGTPELKATLMELGIQFPQ